MSTPLEPLTIPIKKNSDLQKNLYSSILRSCKNNEDNSYFANKKVRYSNILREYHKCLKKERNSKTEKVKCENVKILYK